MYVEFVVEDDRWVGRGADDRWVERGEFDRQQDGWKMTAGWGGVSLTASSVSAYQETSYNRLQLMTRDAKLR